MRVADYLAAERTALAAGLALADAQRFRHNEPRQIRAWVQQLDILYLALSDWPDAVDWDLVLGFDLHRLGRRIDAVLVTPRAVMVLEFKAGAQGFTLADRRQTEDYALDLQDFHAGSRGHVIVPILVATAATPGPTPWPLLLAGATPVLDASAASLGALLRGLWQRLHAANACVDVAGWQAAPYRPVPGIIEAARSLYATNSVADIAAARADATNLTRTTDTILGAVGQARHDGRHIVVFVTGIPGAGKTLCGLNAVFGAGHQGIAAFLTGNPTLVHVLREALARDSAGRGHLTLRAARQRMEAQIQALPHFRDSYLGKHPGPPPEHVIVIDEAQRAWTTEKAIRAGRDRAVALSDSEPGHLLDIMARHDGWAVIVCLIGQGQEIHDGEGGMAGWGAALQTRPDWQIRAAPAALAEAGARQRLPALPSLTTDPALHLTVPVRSLHSTAAGPFVDALLRNDLAQARMIAQTHGPLPFRLTRSLAAMRAHLRAAGRGLRRAGLVGSAGAVRRLRADGIGHELAHMDSAEVAHWFLDRWPDIRASDALEVMASEFSVQGLELDHVGLCWGGDLVRAGGLWQARRMVGTAWQTDRQPERIANRINTYRVLLTRARHETVIWVPEGDDADPTRQPRDLDALADLLRDCGIATLVTVPAASQSGRIFTLL